MTRPRILSAGSRHLVGTVPNIGAWCGEMSSHPGAFATTKATARQIKACIRICKAHHSPDSTATARTHNARSRRALTRSAAAKRVAATIP